MRRFVIHNKGLADADRGVGTALQTATLAEMGRSIAGFAQDATVKVTM